MPLSKLTFQPGINTQATPTLNEGGWSASNLIRWKDGFLEKLGGWTQLFATEIAGLARGLHAYQGLSNDDYLLIGSDDGIQVYFNGTLYGLLLGGINVDLDAQTGVSWLSATAASSIYGVFDVNHGRVMGDLVQIVIPAQVLGLSIGVGGVTLYPQTTTVVSVIDADNYTIQTNTVALTTNTGGGPPVFTAGRNSIYVNVLLANHGLSAFDVFTVQVGVTTAGVTIAPGNYSVAFVTDTYNFSLNLSPQRGTKDGDQQYELKDPVTFDPLGRLAYTQAVPLVDNWFLDNFGNIALLLYENGPIFTWTPPPSSGLFATILSTPAPQAAAGMFVAMPQAQIIAFGAEVNGIQDALLLRWCDAGDYTQWTADANNQAGSFRLSRGSKIVGGLQASQITLIWTDVDVWAMQYIGTPFIYSFNIMGAGCGLIAPRACTTMHNITYWMSQKQFFTFSGGGSVAPLPCDVWDIIFDDLDTSNVSKCFAGSNAAYNEVWFFYPSASGAASECDSYAKLNVINGKWDYGKLDRTAWIDQTIFGPPIATDLQRIVQQHEEGYDANGAAMDGAYALSGYIDLGDGADLLFIDQIIPDFKWFGTDGSVKLTIYATSYPGQSPSMMGPFTVTQTTRFISLRIRARQLAFKVEWSAVKGFSARLGALRYRSAPAGRRP